MNPSKKTKLLPIPFFFAGLLFSSVAGNKPKLPTGETRDDVLRLFQNPPAEFRSAPLWVWNDDITEDQIGEQLADFNAKGIGGVFIHPRPGLITPYLSERWFHLCRVAVAEGKKQGMRIWLYDENSYPSGFAGGRK